MNVADPRLVVAIIVDVFGWVFLVIDNVALAAILFVVGAILALYSVFDWLTASGKPSL
jgi:hypothetical protein